MGLQSLHSSVYKYIFIGEKQTVDLGITTFLDLSLMLNFTSAGSNFMFIGYKLKTDGRSWCSNLFKESSSMLNLTFTGLKSLFIG